jgi:hypothetical protein
MANNKIAICLGVVVSVAVIGEANADYRGRFSTTGSRPELRSERREILNKRIELRKDLRELDRKRLELRRDVWRGAPPARIARDKVEIRRDSRALARQRQELWDHYRDSRRFGWYRHPDGRWYRYPPYRYGWRR